MEVWHEDSFISISGIIRSDSPVKDVLISFTGVGHALNGIDVQKPEFWSAGREYCAMVFVSDLTRSWGNAIDFDFIAKLITRKFGSARYFALGNSMGGFNAIAMSRYLKIDRVVAIVPQYSVHPDDVPWEKRWRNYRRQIKAWPVRNLCESMTAVTDFVIIVGEDRNDRRHAKLIPSGSNIEKIFIDGADHNLAARLKELNLMNLVIGRALFGELTPTWLSDYFSKHDIQALGVCME